MCVRSNLKTETANQTKGIREMKSANLKTLAVIPGRRWRALLIALVVVAAALPSACNKPAENPGSQSNDGRMKVGFITVGPVSDWGYNYAHNQGRLYLEASMSKDVQTTIVENVPESAEVERVMERMIASGTKLIFPT